tara:strand:+ start:1064 stop:2152 length:1089 start_codon:yes stop_codon:yes gene_type:complete
MKKKVIIFMPSIEGGGVEKNLFIISNYLASRVKKLSLITISKKYKKRFKKPIRFISPSSETWDKLGRRIKYFLALIFLIREISLDRDVTVFSFQANIYCIIICKIFSVRVISRSNSAPIGWSKNSIKKIIFKYFLKKADKTIVNSMEFKKDLKKEFNVNAKCIYNPLDKNEIYKMSKINYKKYFKSKKKLRILNIGRFTEQKDQITLLRSLNYLKNKINFEAIIVGKGIEKKNLLNFIKENDLEKNVCILNFLNNPYPIIKETDLFVLSSKYEGLPNVLLEALVLKKMIISSNCRTGPNEILLNGKGGLLFNVGDHIQLYKKILYYVKNKKKCNRMVKIGMKNLNRFEKKKNLEKYLHFITS